MHEAVKLQTKVHKFLIPLKPQQLAKNFRFLFKELHTVLSINSYLVELL